MEFDLKKAYCYYFNEFTKIPHGSYNEKAISDYIVSFAVEHGLKYKQDDMFNVIVYKEGSAGCEDAAPLMLQAHIDMVCEKNKDVEHDFTKDPLKLVVEEDWLTAVGTTLGADDCAGASYILAILADDSLKHPPLEGVFTVQEEVGLTGAMAIKAEDIKSMRCINLDGGGETVTALSSAGGCRVDMVTPMPKEENTNPLYTIKIRGLLGGHSGGCIKLERGNAIKTAFRIAKEMNNAGVDMRFVSADGGSKDNAIPRECDLTFSSSVSYETMKEAFDRSVAAIKEELEFSDAGFNPSFEKEEEVLPACSEADTMKLIDLLFLMPNGFRHRSMAIEGLTVTSLNVGVMHTEGEEVKTTISVRSAMESGITHLTDTIGELTKIFGSTMAIRSRYPGWNYSKVSLMRDNLAEAVQELYNKELGTVAVHGGFEAGIWSALHPGMDILSMGPIAENVHTPDERLNLPSFDRTYTLLCRVVEKCC